MKSTKLMLITILCLILSSLSGCKKDIVESLLKNATIYFIVPTIVYNDWLYQ